MALFELFNLSKTFKHLYGDPRAVSIINLKPKLVKYSKISGDSSKLPFHHNHKGKSSIDNSSIIFNPLSLGNPSIHLGQVIGLRLIAKISEVQKNNTCVILGCESVECMRLEAGGMANICLLYTSDAADE